MLSVAEKYLSIMRSNHHGQCGFFYGYTIIMEEMVCPTLLVAQEDKLLSAGDMPVLPGLGSSWTCPVYALLEGRL